MTSYTQSVFFTWGHLPGIKLSLLLLLLAFPLLYCFYWDAFESSGVVQMKGVWKRLPYGKLIRVSATVAAYALLLLAGIPQTGLLQSLDFLDWAADLYLRLEPLQAIGVLLAALYARVLHGSRYEYLQTINFVTRLPIFLSVFSTLLVGQIPLVWYNVLWFLLVGVIFAWLELAALRPPPVGLPTTKNLFDPVAAYDGLLPLRQAQADKLVNIIRSQNSSGTSICVSGPWGCGKTSLMLGALDKLRCEGDSRSNEVLFIRALELDTLTALFTYVFGRIKAMLKERGAYVGAGSECQKLLASAGGLITNERITSLLEWKLFHTAEDYRSQHDQLEQLICEVFKDDKLIIVVDDIERCAPKKALEFLFFIKEFAVMRCCIAVFLTDYEHLPNPTGGAASDASPDFYDKFFNYRLNLAPISPLDVIRVQESGQDAKSHWEKVEPLSVIYQRIRSILTRRSEECLKHAEDVAEGAGWAEQSKKSTYLSKCVEKLDESMSRPRPVIKVCEAYRNWATQLQEIYHRVPADQLDCYFITIPLGESLFFLSYLEACFPQEFDTLVQGDASIYLDELSECSDEEPRPFLAELMRESLLPKEGLLPYRDYRQEKGRRFLRILLRSPQSLPEIMDGFTSQEEAWFNAVRERNMDVIAAQWVEIINAVVESYPKLFDGRNLLDTLLQFGWEQVREERWGADMLFQLFDFSVLSRHYLVSASGVVPFVDAFTSTYDSAGGIELLTGLPQRSHQLAVSFAQNYLYQFGTPFTRVLDYGMEEKDSKRFFRMIEIVSAEKDFYKILDRFLQNTRLIEPWLERIPEPLHGADGLERLAHSAEAILAENGFSGYDDVRCELACMWTTVAEIKALLRLLDELEATLKEAERGFLIGDLSLESLPKVIRSLSERVRASNVAQDGYLPEDLRNLFEFINLLNPEEAEALPDELIPQLQALASDFASATGFPVHAFRNVLLRRIRRSTPREESFV